MAVINDPGGAKAGGSPMTYQDYLRNKDLWYKAQSAGDQATMDALNKANTQYRRQNNLADTKTDIDLKYQTKPPATTTPKPPAPTYSAPKPTAPAPTVGSLTGNNLFTEKRPYTAAEVRRMLGLPETGTLTEAQIQQAGLLFNKSGGDHGHPLDMSILPALLNGGYDTRDFSVKDNQVFVDGTPYNSPTGGGGGGTPVGGAVAAVGAQAASSPRQAASAGGRTGAGGDLRTMLMQYLSGGGNGQVSTANVPQLLQQMGLTGQGTPTLDLINRALGHAETNSAQNLSGRATSMSSLLQLMGLDENARQFNTTFPLQEAQLTGQYGGAPTLAAQQFQQNQWNDRVNAATNLSRLFGTAVTPTESGANLFGQVAGMDTIDKWSAMLPWTQGMTPYQQAQIAAQYAGINAGGGSAQDRTNDQLRGAFMDFTNDLAGGKYADRNAAMLYVNGYLNSPDAVMQELGQRMAGAVNSRWAPPAPASQSPTQQGNAWVDALNSIAYPTAGSPWAGFPAGLR